MLELLADSYLVHPLRGLGYQFFSGIGSSISEWLTTLVTIGTFLGVWWKHHNCHVHRCWRWQWHPHPVHGHPVCKRHHPHHKKGGGHSHRVTEEGLVAHK